MAARWCAVIERREDARRREAGERSFEPRYRLVMVTRKSSS